MITLRKINFTVLVLLFLLSGCMGSHHTVKVVKPKKHYVFYKQEKHAKRKKTKIVRYKAF